MLIDERVKQGEPLDEAIEAIDTYCLPPDEARARQNAKAAEKLGLLMPIQGTPP